MKAIGIVRKIDSLGRIVLPVEIRNNFYMSIQDPLEIFIDQDSIILKKFHPMSCIFCGERQDVISFKGKYICCQCLNNLPKLK